MGILQTIHHALGFKRYLILGVALGLSRGYEWLASSEKMTISLPNIPWWESFIWFALLYILYCFLMRLNELEKRLEPKLKLSYTGESGSYSVTPMKEKDYRGQVLNEYEALYIRLKAETIANGRVEKCSAYLIGIEQKIKSDFLPTKFTDPIWLPWSQLNVPEIDIPYMIGRYFDVLHVKSTDNKLDFCGQYGLKLRDFFSSHTTYRLTIAVSSGDTTEKIKIDVIWNGKWNEVEVRELGNE